MRMLSLSLVTLAVLSLVPATSAQQAASIRKANIQAQATKTMAQQKARAKSMARFHAWQKSVGFHNQKNVNRSWSKNQGQGQFQGKAMNPMKSKQMKSQQMQSKGRKVNPMPINLSKEFGKRYQIKAALRARQQALVKAKMHMQQKGR